MDEVVTEIVTLLSKTTGRIVVTGVGKSALIGQKMVATFNSTGTKSIFIHAADALHGDLGAIQKDDSVICISKSGETQEIKVLLPHLKKRDLLIIGMVSKKGSFLDTMADFSIYIPIEKEADPNNLAPTASTTAQLAMGDALAMALQSLNKFTSDHFAENHPGGNLGKMLHTMVKDISTKNAKPFVNKSTLINQVILTMTSARLGASAVVDEQNNILGIITDGDLRRMLQKIGYNENTVAQEIMNNSPKSVSSNLLASEAMKLMHTFAVSQLLVVDENGLYDGIIHLHDLIREGIE
jgi:arabinose-5-phosphate isomerase